MIWPLHKDFKTCLSEIHSEIIRRSLIPMAEDFRGLVECEIREVSVKATLYHHIKGSSFNHRLAEW